MNIENTKTRFVLNETVRIRDGFYKGYKGKVRDYKVDKELVYYDVETDISDVPLRIPEKNLVKTHIFGLL